jgi:hypothetical protein
MKLRLACMGDFVSRLDAGETAFLEQQLRFVETETYNVLDSKLKSKDFVPFDESLPEWADTWVYRSWSGSGMSELISRYSDDLPRVDVMVEETPHKTSHWGNAYGYTIDELEKSAVLNQPLDAMKAIEARNAADRRIDQIAATGIPQLNIKGLVNNTNVPAVTVTNGDWLDETDPYKIAADMFEAENAVITQSGEHHMPTTFLLAPAYYSKIASMPIGNGADKTVLKYFLENAQSVKEVARWSVLATAGSGGSAIGLVYEKNPQIVKFVLAYAWKSLEPEKRNLEYIVDNLSKVGGTVWYRPLGGARVIGIHE